MAPPLTLVQSTIACLISCDLVVKPKKQSIYACNHTDDAFEQLIVNQRCNLVIQYLEKQAKETSLTGETNSNSASKVARKRDIDQVNKFNSKISSDEDDDESSKSNKKKRTQIDENMSFQQALLMERRLAFAMQPSAAGASSSNQGTDSNEAENIIEVDDLNPTNNSSASNNNDDEIDV